jgi:hypothetical protein
VRTDGDGNVSTSDARHAGCDNDRKCRVSQIVITDEDQIQMPESESSMNLNVNYHGSIHHPRYLADLCWVSLGPRASWGLETKCFQCAKVIWEVTSCGLLLPDPIQSC